MTKIYDEIIMPDDENEITKTAPKEAIAKNSFTSNPCNTAAAQYIAKCIRLNKKPSTYGYGHATEEHETESLISQN